MIFMVMDTKNIGSDLASLQKTGCYIPWRQFSIIYGNMAKIGSCVCRDSWKGWIHTHCISAYHIHILCPVYVYVWSWASQKYSHGFHEMSPSQEHHGPWSFQAWRVAWTKPGWCPHHCRAKGRLYPPWFRSAFPAHSPAPNFAPRRWPSLRICEKNCVMALLSTTTKIRVY